MIGVLLAAGVGRRLGHDRPKALLEIGGRTLLDRHLENLAALGMDVLVVTGFQAERFEGLSGVHNPEYRRGSLLSLKVALETVDEDAVLMDADVLYHPSILADVAALERGFALDPRTDPGEEEMMLGVAEGKVRAIRRGRLAGFDLVGEGVGFFKWDRASLPALREAVAHADPDGDYEAALDRFLGVHGADYVLVGDRPWTEIDFPEDVERAETEILPGI
ncbi:MAG: phosphocholine cytidylyltransferase family protein [Planctomycetota bacterium]